MPTSQGTYTPPNNFVQQYDQGQKKIRADLVDENFTDAAAAITQNITDIATAQTTANNAASAAAAAQSTADSAVAAAAAATTTSRGTARLATPAEVQAGAASASPLPAVLNINNARNLPKATNALFGLGRSATAAEATAGATSGTGPAWVTPEQLKTGLSKKTDGTVELKSTRTTSGAWTITDLTVGKPLIILINGSGTSVTITLRTQSGADGGINSSGSFVMGGGQYSTDVFICIPTTATVVINITNSVASTTTIHAYQ